MDVANGTNEKGPLILAAATLVLAGVMLLYVSWENVKRQREAVDRHLLLTAQSVLRSVESSLRVGMGHMLEEPGAMAFRPGMRRLLLELERSGDVLFVGVFEKQGGRIISLREDAGAKRLELPPEALAALRESGEWHGMVRFGDLQGFAYGRLARPGVLRFFGQRRGLGRGAGRGPGAGHESGPPGGSGGLSGQETVRPDGLGPDDLSGSGFGDSGLPGSGGSGMMGPGGMMGQGMMGSMGSVEALPDVYIIVGLDVSDHLAVYRNFRRNAMFHTAYVLTAAMLVWFLAVGFMRRRTLAGRAASLERFQSRLLDNLPDGLVTVDGRGVIRAANPAAHVILDAEPGELAGRSCTSIGPEAAACLRASRDGASTWRHHEIGGRSLEILALPLPDETSGLGRMVLLRDRTRLRSMERSLGEAQRLAAIGRLAAGVAHEIRNPLSALRGFAQLFAKKFSPGQPEKEYADTMVREADRLNRVITDLLFLSKPRSVEPVDVDLEELAAELSRLLEMDLSAKGVTLRTELAAPTVHADRDMLKQALLNLVLNSMEAMEEAMEEARADAHDDAGIRAPGGAVVLRSRAVVPADAAAYRGRGGADGDGGPAVGPGAVEVCVQDDGPGMDPGLADSAFEPFYTAKRTGTGLGLAFVRKTARDHGGEAVIRSEPGRGCAVCMLFPGPEATAASADAAPAGAGTTVADGTTVVGAADAPRGPAAARSGAAIPLPDGPITPPGPSKAGGPTESTGEHSPRGGRR